MIRLQDVEVCYGTLRALAGVTCAVESGAVGLLGPNGAGKSTLLKTLLGFLRAERGAVEMFGMTMPEHAVQARRFLGYMPEKDIVSPQVSAVSFLTYCGSLFGMSRADAMERTHEVLNFVGLDDERYRKMETYSTGMCQRVKFAQALIHDPKLLLLDEPTNGMDPAGRQEMLGLISQLARKRSVTVLLSSHLLPDVEMVCDRVIVISKGRIVRDGTVEELTAFRDGVFELRVRDNAEPFLERLTAMGCGLRPQQDGTILLIKPQQTAIRDFFEAARAAKTQIRRLHPVRQRLEEMFMQAIREPPAEDATHKEG